MASMYTSDLLRILSTYEASRLKIWEIARTYNKIDFARFLYLLTNVRRVKKRTNVSLKEYDMSRVENVCCECTCDTNIDARSPLELYDPYGCGGNVRFELTTTIDPTLRIDRAVFRRTCGRLWLLQRMHVPSRFVPSEMDDETSNCNQRCPKCHFPVRVRINPNSLREIDYPLKRIHYLLKNPMYRLDQLPTQVRLAVHNISTVAFQQILESIKNLLFPSDFQVERNTPATTKQQLNSQYLRFYDALRYGKWTCETDPYMIRYIMVFPMRRFFDRNLSDAVHAGRQYPIPDSADYYDDVDDDEDEPGTTAEQPTGTTTTSFDGYYWPHRPIDPLADGSSLHATLVAEGRFSLIDQPAVPISSHIFVRKDTDVFTGTEKELMIEHSSRNAILSQYIVQPLYQGFRLVVYSTPTETRCYNQYGELCQNFGYHEARTKVSCIFEAIILPVDRKKMVRSWRFWPYKHNWVMYVVDVFRYNTELLMSNTFLERAEYIDLIVDNRKLRRIPNMFTNLNTHVTAETAWTNLEQWYSSRQDMYGPIAGVVLRDPNHRLIPAGKTFNDQERGLRPVAYYFPVRYAYDILENTIVDMRTQTEQAVNVRQLHINCEMADYKTLCVAYAYNSTHIFLCRYNRRLHQFVHAASLPRMPGDFFSTAKFVFRTERIFVLHAVVRPHGVLYLRIYYDRSGLIIGYENKRTDSRYKVPLSIDPILIAGARCI